VGDAAPAIADRTRGPGIDVEVAVLGSVEIRGAARAFTRAWARELVVYLAVHPTGASNDVWSTALWPDRVMAPSSLHSTASVARRALGKTREGIDHLPRSHGRLALGPSVGTDWDRFLTLSTSEDPDEWRAALELVRGRPFDGLRSTDWAILDGTAPSMESAIVDLSGRLAGACLRAGDPRGAEWSARRGLLVSPYDERLYRMLLRAADAAGNPGGVESVMVELVRVVADEIEPIESVHPSTLALYRSLSRRRVPTM
jgi:DNA-binding SARP family transcriptional activator